MDQEGWIKIYREKGALWLHDGNPKRPHARLTSGRHSDGFFDSGRVVEDVFSLNRGCIDLVERLRVVGFDFGMVDRVVGPALGAITLASHLAYRIAVCRGRTCLSGFAEKQVMADGKTIMVFSRTAIKSGERVLIGEDVTTTGGSVELVAEAVVRAGGIVLPFVATLVNRSGLTEIDGRQIVPLIDRPMPMWPAEDCPLCLKGSEAIRPKAEEGANWLRLNAAY